jgi:predicted short-subunit dehydrogenase-like oxidoreductase (DUF2520 family)
VIAEKRIGIIGRGALGKSLYAELKEFGYEVRFFPGTQLDQHYSEVGTCTIIFICVPDGAIAGVAEQLGTELDGQHEIEIAAHCSGSLNSSILSPLSRKGISCISSHPIQTFSKAALQTFRGCYVSLEGNSDAIEVVRRVFESIGAKTFMVNAEQKQAIHVAAVFASNFMVALESSAQNIMDLSGVDESASQIFEPLMRSTMENIKNLSLYNALSGPVKRGDLPTINHHEKWLQDNAPEYLTLYKELTSKLIDLTNGKNE